MRNKLLSMIASAIMFSTASFAQDAVEIHSAGGTLVLKGTLQSYDEESFILKTSVGVLNIARSQAECFGAACPSDTEVASEFVLSAETVAGGDLAVRLLAGYAADIGAEVFIKFDQEMGALQVRLADDAKGDVAKALIARADAETAFQSLLNGTSKMVLTTRRPNDAERAAFAAANRSYILSAKNELVLALDGLSIAVSGTNPTRAISLDNAAAIFSGQIQNWSALGGVDAPIKLLAAGEATTSFFATQVLGPRGLTLSPSVQTLASEADAASAVQSDPTAISLMTIAGAEGLRALPIRLACGLTAPPTSFAMKAEEYPLTRRLFLYADRGQLPLRARELLAYSQSDIGQREISEKGFLGQTIARRDMGAFGVRLAAALVSADDSAGVDQLRTMASVLTDAEQLSTTLRFRSGSSDLDSKAQRDIIRLASIFSEYTSSDREVLLVGFTDNVGRLDLNNVLSERRALQVKENIINASGGRINPDLIKIIGFGPTAPISCNDTVEGRDVNRRVEVWLREAR